MDTTVSNSYILGHADREHRRLIFQASLHNPFTEQFLRRAGLTAGMRVLDVGCGVGEVSMIAAHLVGYRGHVTGIDMDAGALALAARRCQERGLDQVTFLQQDIHHFRADSAFDAVIGRHILIHTREPGTVLKMAAANLRPGGLVAFHEIDGTVLDLWQDLPLAGQLVALSQEVMLTVHDLPKLGPRLHTLLADAGFQAIDCRGEYEIGGGADSRLYEWFAVTLGALFPAIEAAGLARAADWSLETLAQRLQQETVAQGRGLPGPVIIAASGRKA
jgi:2-polyprenyl-3-methyl-5-hydroxy-6-metoxy-1,4-benzoquinol methylase